MSSSDKPETPPKRPGPLRLKAVVLLPVLFGAAALCYWLMIDGVIKDQLEAQSAAFAGEGGQAEVESVNFSIFGPRLRITNLRAWQNLDDGRQHEVAYLGEADLDIEFWPLLERRVVINNISATTIRYQGARKTKEPPPPEQVPTDTNQPNLNEYLEEVRKILQSEELAELRDWLEKLQEHMRKTETEPPAEPEPEVVVVEEDELGPATRARYVEDALARAEAKPTVVIKNASLAEFEVTWGRPDKPRFANKVTNLELRAESVSSDPVAYKLPMKFKAAGDLDGDANRRVELGLTVRFDPNELIKIEQVDGTIGIKSLDISGLVDADVFGRKLLDAQLTVAHFAAVHPESSGRTRLRIAGLIQPPGFATPTKASFAIWFGGFQSAGGWMAMVPSGVSVQVEDFPLAPVLKLAGGSPLPLSDDNATISFGTCDANGDFGTPEAAFTWHDGVKVHLRLQVKGLTFAEKDGELAGLPAGFLARGLNKVIEGLGGLDVIVGFEGSKQQIALDLEKPGLRAFVDAIINALSITAPEFQSMVELPFEVSSSASFGLSSVNADGSVRDPKLSLTGEARHDMNDLRVGLNLRDVTLKPRAGHSTIIGLPAADFCRAFNGFMGTLGPDGLKMRTRLMNAEGTFSPALESPGLRGLVDAMAGVLRYTGAQINSSFNLPLTIAPQTMIQCESVDTGGKVRTLASPGADSNSLENLRLRLRAASFTVSPKAGHNQILGLPAKEFCTAFNTFVQAQGANGVSLDWLLLDAKGSFAPALKQPGTRGLVDGIVSTLRYSGAQLNANFDLPFKLDDRATISPTSIDADGKVRTLSGPDSGSNDLKGLTIAFVLKDGWVEKKAGENTILGIPADYFTFAWNKLMASYAPNGMSMRIRLFNDKGEYAPALVAPTEKDLVKQLGAMVGIGNFEKDFAKIVENFAKEFPAFQKDGLKVAKDIAEGKFKPPEIEPPKIDPPKFPWK